MYDWMTDRGIKEWVMALPGDDKEAYHRYSKSEMSVAPQFLYKDWDKQEKCLPLPIHELAELVYDLFAWFLKCTVFVLEFLFIFFAGTWQPCS